MMSRRRLGSASTACSCYAALFLGNLPQSLVDPLLPTRPILLKEVEDVPIDAQGHHLFRTGMEGVLGAGSAGLAVAFLKAASTAFHGSPVAFDMRSSPAS